MYFVYKITNLINGKWYIGVHKTENVNDGYMGSGRAIKNAIIKHGIENFSKEILFTTDIESEAYDLENNLTKDTYNSNSNYNMKPGGVGGFSKEDAYKGYLAHAANMTFEERSKIGKIAISRGYGFGGRYGPNHKEAARKGGLVVQQKRKEALLENPDIFLHDEETKQKISESLKKYYTSIPGGERKRSKESVDKQQKTRIERGQNVISDEQKLKLSIAGKAAWEKRKAKKD